MNPYLDAINDAKIILEDAIKENDLLLLNKKPVEWFMLNYWEWTNMVTPLLPTKSKEFNNQFHNLRAALLSYLDCQVASTYWEIGIN